MERLLTIRQPWAWAVARGHKDVENRSGGASRWARVADTQLWVHAASTWSPRGAANPHVVRAWVAATGEPDPYRAKLDPPTRVPGTRLRLHPTTGYPDPYPPYPEAAQLHLGAVIGRVLVTDVHNAERGCCPSPWAEDHYHEAGGTVRADLVHLVLAHARHLPEPVPAAGRLGLWRPDPDLATELAEAELVPA